MSDCYGSRQWLCFARRASSAAGQRQCIARADKRQTRALLPAVGPSFRDDAIAHRVPDSEVRQDFGELLSFAVPMTLMHADTSSL